MARILVCDDDDDMIEFCERLFKMKGHELLVARNGADAVSAAQSEAPELILMDMKMPVAPGGNVSERAGIEATEQIRLGGANETVRIIALTGHIMKEFRESIFAAGCDDMLEKPITDFTLLLSAIDRNLEAERGA